MTLKTVFRRAACREYEEAAQWYEARRAGLGIEFTAEIDRGVRRAAEAPQQFPVVLGDVRCVRARRFPYTIFFRVRANRIVVLAVFHARRDPAVWRERA